MARKLNPNEYADRRNEILDVALQLVYTKGYEAMTVQDILDRLKISKGAFYHYFDSKPALLEALVDRMQVEAEQAVLPVLSNPDLNALEKLHGWFASAYRWKTEHRAMVIGLLDIWYTDENAIVRDKVFSLRARRYISHLAQIIRQGIDEGIFSPIQPEIAGEILLYIFLGLGETFARLILEYNAGKSESPGFEAYLSAYTEAVERVIGAPKTTVQLFDLESLKLWFTRDDDAIDETPLSGDRGPVEMQPLSPVLKV